MSGCPFAASPGVGETSCSPTPRSCSAGSAVAWTPIEHGGAGRTGGGEHRRYGRRGGDRRNRTWPTERAEMGLGGCGDRRPLCSQPVRVDGLVSARSYSRACKKRAATNPAIPPVAAEPRLNAVSLMRVVVGGGEDARPLVVGIFDGGMASIGAEHGPSFGLLGRRHGDEFTVFVVLLDAARSQKGGTARQVGTLHLRRNQPISWAHEGLRIRIEWVESRAASPAAPEPSPGRSTECTITCNSLVVTAATVETSCGKCCEPTACTPTR